VNSKSQPDYYDIFQISSSSTSDQIKDAYRALALERHPHKNNGTNEATKATKLVFILPQALMTIANSSYILSSTKHTTPSATLLRASHTNNKYHAQRNQQEDSMKGAFNTRFYEIEREPAQKTYTPYKSSFTRTDGYRAEMDSLNQTLTELQEHLERRAKKDADRTQALHDTFIETMKLSNWTASMFPDAVGKQVRLRQWACSDHELCAATFLEYKTVKILSEELKDLKAKEGLMAWSIGGGGRNMQS
jgi:hypothetical protein